MQTATALDSDLFRKACSRFATGIAVATVSTPGGAPAGITVNSFTSVSCCPPLVLVCIDYRSRILPQFRSSSYYGINVLRDDQRDLSVRFSQRSSDCFDGIDWRPAGSGVPMIENCLASFECCVTQTVEAGDHALFIGEVVSAEYRDGRPLIYFSSAYQHLSD